MAIIDKYSIGAYELLGVIEGTSSFDIPILSIDSDGTLKTIGTGSLDIPVVGVNANGTVVSDTITGIASFDIPIITLNTPSRIAPLGIIRDTYNAIRDRLLNNTKFRDYFAVLDFDKQTKQIDYPYCRIDVGGYNTIPSQVTNIQTPTLTLDITIMVDVEDDDRLSENLFNAIEIFCNAYDGDDPTFNDGVKGRVMYTEKDFESFEQLDGSIIGTVGTITNELQRYKNGSL